MSRLPEASDFIRAIARDDLQSGRHSRVVTRFPPEPNGYLHIGHAKSICLNFGLAQESGGVCHLRFDDTNPETEDPEFVSSIQNDVRWLGFEWGDRIFYASDYYDQLYAWALELIDRGLAYVCFLSEEDMRSWRGTVSEPGRPSPWRESSPAQNRYLLDLMRKGAFPEGSCTLRAKIDMASPNMKMRDPAMYRIKKAHHYRTGDAWSIYPIYDFAHGLSDAIEGITHSICTLEFENNRELYDWYVAHVTAPCKPRQIEFARLNLTYMVMSKRFLKQLVESGRVSGWDDPRMPTLAGLRRRGVPPEALRSFCEDIGVARSNSLVELARLEHHIRAVLNASAPRRIAVVDPLLVELSGVEPAQISAPDFSEAPEGGGRELRLSNRIYIEREDFALEASPGFYRLVPGGAVRLRHAGLLVCDEVLRGEGGEVLGLRGHIEAEGARKVKATIHWLDADTSLPAELRLYDRLFKVERPGEAHGGDFLPDLNPEALRITTTARVEPDLAGATPATRYQFERIGYFVADSADHQGGRLVFNRIVTLKDSREEARPAPKAAEAPAPAPKAAEVRDPRAGLSPEALARYELAAGLGLGPSECRALSSDPQLWALFDEARISAPARGVANWLVSELPAALKGRPLGPQLSATALSTLVNLIEGNAITGAAGKQVLAALLERGGDPRALVTELGLSAVSDDGSLLEIVDRVLAAHPKEAERLRAGEEKLVGFFVGRMMKESRGRADAARLTALLRSRL